MTIAQRNSLGFNSCDSQRDEIRPIIAGFRHLYDFSLNFGTITEHDIIDVRVDRIDGFPVSDNCGRGREDPGFRDSSQSYLP